MDKKRLSEGHLLSGDSRWQDLSGYREKPLIRKHSPTGDGRGRNLSRHGKKTTVQGHTLSGGSRGSGLLGVLEHRQKLSERGVLTVWRQQNEVPIRTLNEAN